MPPPIHLCLPPTPTINTDRIPEPPLPSSSIASTSASTAPAPTVTALNPNTPTNVNLTIADSSNVDSVNICPHCGLTLTSHIGLLGHLRIHRTESGELGPGAPTYTRRIRLHYPHCLRISAHRMGLLGHIGAHEGGIHRSLETPGTSCTPTMPSPTHTSVHRTHHQQLHRRRRGHHHRNRH
nr:unnamed protein product [Spirometra erinaceieuropaei]